MRYQHRKIGTRSYARLLVKRLTGFRRLRLVTPFVPQKAAKSFAGMYSQIAVSRSGIQVNDGNYGSAGSSLRIKWCISRWQRFCMDRESDSF